VAVLEVGSGDDPSDAGHGKRRRGVDPGQASVGVRAADERNMEGTVEPRMREVRRECSCAAEQGVVLQSRQSPPRPTHLAA
jgi:hypothetical protein